MFDRFRFSLIRRLAGKTPVALNLRLRGGWLCGDLAVRGAVIDFDEPAAARECHACRDPLGGEALPFIAVPVALDRENVVIVCLRCANAPRRGVE